MHLPCFSRWKTGALRSQADHTCAITSVHRPRYRRQVQERCRARWSWWASSKHGFCTSSVGKSGPFNLVIKEEGSAAARLRIASLTWLRCWPDEDRLSWLVPSGFLLGWCLKALARNRCTCRDLQEPYQVSWCSLALCRVWWEKNSTSSRRLRIGLGEIRPPINQQHAWKERALLRGMPLQWRKRLWTIQSWHPLCCLMASQDVRPFLAIPPCVWLWP